MDFLEIIKICVTNYFCIKVNKEIIYFTLTSKIQRNFVP